MWTSTVLSSFCDEVMKQHLTFACFWTCGKRPNLPLVLEVWEKVDPCSARLAFLSTPSPFYGRTNHVGWVTKVLIQLSMEDPEVLV